MPSSRQWIEGCGVAKINGVDYALIVGGHGTSVCVQYIIKTLRQSKIAMTSVH